MQLIHMEESISQLIDKAGNFSEEEAQLLIDEITFREISEGTNLVDLNEVCSAIWYVVSGSFFQFSLDDERQKNVIDLNVPGDWVINHKSFTTRNPSEAIIQAYEDSTVYALSMDSIHKLIALSPSFFQLGSILEGSNARVEFYDHNLSPDEKYSFILEHRPRLLQTFPLTMIASYLKITPETMSRVRKRMTQL